ncbi:hypothetical protein GQ600_17255 [Phytophthora cactorum]|nr:hypothetical protein GQ600_17255 [Phytophthora cactorum]
MKNLMQLSGMSLDAGTAYMVHDPHAPLAIAVGRAQLDRLLLAGMGLWLNYTDHVGDPRFDPGNSLWVPPKRAERIPTVRNGTPSTQQSFCADAVGELHKQYCQVMEVYCGTAMTFLQLMLSMMAGYKYLMHLCVFNGIGCLVSAVVWYFFVFQLIINSTFYKDQFNRCSENDSGRTRVIPVLAVLVISHVTNKFRRFQQLLLPAPVVDMKSQVLSSRRNETQVSAEVALDVEEYLESTKLAPLKKHPSAVQSRDVSNEDSKGEEHKESELEDKEPI